MLLALEYFMTTQNMDKEYIKRFLADKSEKFIKDFNWCLEEIEGKFNDVEIVNKILNDKLINQIGTRIVGIYRQAYDINRWGRYKPIQLIFISENKIYSKTYGIDNFPQKYYQIKREKSLEKLLS